MLNYIYGRELSRINIKTKSLANPISKTMSGVDKSGSTYLQFVKPLCGGGTIIDDEASSLINFVNPEKAPTKCFAWKKKWDGSEFSFKGCDTLTWSGEGKDGSTVGLKKGMCMAWTTVQGGITMDFKFGKTQDFSGDGSCTKTVGGAMDWGEISPNLFGFTGGCQSIKCCLPGSNGKKANVNFGSFGGLVYTQPNWNWSGTFLNKLTENKKFFREGFFFNQGAF